MEMNGKDMGPRRLNSFDALELGRDPAHHSTSLEQLAENGYDFDDSASPWADEEAVPPDLRELVVLQAVEMLPLDLRELHDAVYVQRLSQREAAEHLGISRPLVQYRLKKIAEAVREAVELAELPPSEETP